MLNQLSLIDLVVMILLLLIMPTAGIWVAMRKKNAERYFLAGRSIRWWTVAASVFGSNISSFHLIGMLGIGYSIGFVQAHYEIVFPAVLLLAYVFLASYRRLGLFTLSQYLEVRYSPAARLTYTVLLVLIILVQLVGAFYVGSITLQWLFGGTAFAISYTGGLLLIAVITSSYTLGGGMESIVITDTIQSVLMLAAGTAVAFFTFTQPEIGGFSGMLALDAAQPAAAQKMHLYLPASHPNLPWTGIFTGLMLQHCFNFATNQFLVQRALAAASDDDARKGLIASGFLKLTVPFFSIATGVAAYYLFEARFGGADFNADSTFLRLVETVIPSGIGLTGLILAGLTAATFSSVDSMMNAATTLLTVDVYQKYFRQDASDRQLLRFGRGCILALVLAATTIAWFTYTPDRANQFFLKVSAQLSYFTPGIMAAFLFGILSPRSGAKGALLAMALGPLFGVSAEWIWRIIFAKDLNFLHRIALTFLFACTMMGFFNQASDQMQQQGKLLEGVSIRSFLRAIGIFFLLQLPVAALLVFGGWQPIKVAPLGAAAALAAFWPWLQGRQKPLWQDDMFYASVLTAASVFIYYYFA